MIKKSISASPQSGATLIEVLVGVVAIVVLFGGTFLMLNTIREAKRVERTLAGIYALKEEIKKITRNQGSYTQGRMMPLLFAAKSFPDTLNVDYANRSVYTPMGYPIDIIGRNAHFSVDMYDLTPDDCYSLGEQIMQGNFFMLGNTSDDLDFVKIGKKVFSDAKPITQESLQMACTESFTIDLIMAFR